MSEDQKNLFAAVDPPLVERDASDRIIRNPRMLHTNTQGQPSVAAQQGHKLTVTSTMVLVRTDGELVLRCSNCQKVLPLRAFGVRNMGGGELRNQPQCVDCR